MRRLAFGLVLAGLVTLPLAARAELYMGFQIGTVNAPAPPPVVFSQMPVTVVVPGTSVYVVNDPHCNYDVFRSGVYWYTYRSGYWYRCRSHRGPFTVVDVRNVPKQVLTVPPGHWRHYPLAAKQEKPGKAKHGHEHEVVVVTEHDDYRSHENHENHHH